MINEIWRNGELIETIEVEDEPTEEVATDPQLTPEATAQLQADLEGATTIAKIKTALTTFIENLQGGT